MHTHHAYTATFVALFACRVLLASDGTGEGSAGPLTAADPKPAADESTQWHDSEVRARLAFAALTAARDQVEQHKLEQQGNYPSLKEMADGKMTPVNPLTGKSGVVSAGSPDIDAGWTWNEAEGWLRLIVPDTQKDITRRAKKEHFELVEDLRPQMNSMRSVLWTLRGQLELYKIQHQDKVPAWKDMEKWQALTNTTDATGKVGANLPFGPYITGGPTNPMNGKTKIAAAGSATPDDGWTYDEKTGYIKPVVTAAQAKTIAALGEDSEVAK